MIFKKGQAVVHLSHGVGVIQCIETREFSPGKVENFYVVKIQDNGAAKKVFVPFKTAKERLRPVVSKEMGENVLAYIAKDEPDLDNGQTWNRRYREYMELIHSGAIVDIARVYVALKGLPELSFGERKLLDHAKTLLEKEFEAIGLKLPEVKG